VHIKVDSKYISYRKANKKTNSIHRGSKMPLERRNSIYQKDEEINFSYFSFNFSILNQK
jgi:hypothetical protein